MAERTRLHAADDGRSDAMTTTEHEVITREEAKARGLKRYFTGKLCKNGHVAERQVSSKQCVECKRERMREKYANDPEYAARRRERKREWAREKYANDPEYAARVRERKREWDRERRANDPEYAARERERMRELMRERHRERMAAGLCVSCREPAVTKRLCWTCADKDNARRYML